MEGIRTAINYEALNLLGQSLYHKWYKIRDGKGADKGMEDCPLCKRYHVYFAICDGCPIKSATDQDSCCGSPYEEWVKHHELDHGFSKGGLVIKCETCRILVNEFIDFLEDLLQSPS